MRVGPYALERETLPSVAINFMDALRLRARGVPGVPGDTPVEVATEVLKRNAREVLHAGTGHFWFMWVSDFGKALRGAEKVLPPAYLGGLIRYMAREARRLGRVTSCFTGAHGFDMPYWRGDNLPWLILSAAEFTRWTGDRSLAEDLRADLQWLLDDYERAYLRDGLLDRSVTGDWMDTVLRPSSTYNNLCVLRMLQVLPELGLSARAEPEAFQRRLLEERWRGGHFIDHAGTERSSVDAAVMSLYFGLFDPALRGALIEDIEKQGYARPYPIRCAPAPYDTALLSPLARLTAQYHSSIWLHLGFMYLNGLRRAGRDVSRQKAEMEGLIMRHHNMLESIEPDGSPYQTFFFSCECGLSMCAGQYLELALG